MAVVTLWWLRHRIGRAPLACLLIYWGVLAPALGFFDVYPFLFSFVADHYQYHASLAGIPGMVAGVVLLVQRFRLPLQLSALCGLSWLAVLSLLSHSKTYVYFDEQALIQDNIYHYPQSWAAQFRYGRLLDLAGNYSQAEGHLREALRLFLNTRSCTPAWRAT